MAAAEAVAYTVETCPGYKRKSKFSGRCIFCGQPSSAHPPVTFQKAKRQPMTDAEVELLDRGYYRSSMELWRLLRTTFVPKLEHMKGAWAYVLFLETT